MGKKLFETQCIIRDRATAVCNAILHQEGHSAVFSKMDSFDGGGVAESAVVIQQYDSILSKPGQNILMCRIHYVPYEQDGEYVTLPFELLCYRDEEDLKKRVKAYLDKISEPLRKRARWNELYRLYELVKKYPERARMTLEGKELDEVTK